MVNGIPWWPVCAAVGSVNNTFGIQGVEENCFFFKSVDDANRLRSHVSECFERAALPGCFPEVALLSRSLPEGFGPGAVPPLPGPTASRAPRPRVLNSSGCLAATLQMLTSHLIL